MRFARQVAAIVAKDLLIEWRTKDLLATMMVLGLSSVVLFNFAVDFARVPFSELGAPVLWLAFTFTGVTGLARSFGLERENRCLDGMLLAPLDRSVLYAGKLLVNVIVLGALELVLLALGFVLLNQGTGAVSLDGSRWLLLMAVLAVNTVGFAAVGTLFALMAHRTRRGEVLLPLLQITLSLPVLVSAVVATRRVLDVAVPAADVLPLLKLSAVFDVVFACLALVVFEHVVEE